VRDQRLGHLRGKQVYLHIGTDFNPLGVSNYAAIWPYLIGELEAQGNRVFPSREESLLWENKAHMHELFQARGVRCPHTELVSACDLEAHCAHRPFPFLLKEIHSSSSEGVHKIDSPERLKSVAARIQARNRSEIVLVQELLDMRRDLRAIVIGDQVALHYWRINLQDEWRPTATGHGSRVDFVHFPEQWRADIVATLRTCGLQQGAFDIAWRGDDLTTEPIYLEVSPQFQPTPPVAEGELDMNYGAWKKALILGDRGYDKRFFDTLVRLADRYVAVTLGLD
jgi:biotin carboxylase